MYIAYSIYLYCCVCVCVCLFIYFFVNLRESPPTDEPEDPYMWAKLLGQNVDKCRFVCIYMYVYVFVYRYM